MFRKVDLKRLFGKGLVLPYRTLNAQLAQEPATETKFQEEWKNGKPFETIPGMTKFEALCSFFLRGKSLIINGRS